MQNVVGPTLVAMALMATKFGLGAEIQSPNGLLSIVCCSLHYRVDPDSSLHADMLVMKEKEGYDHILFNFTFKVRELLTVQGIGD